MKTKKSAKSTSPKKTRNAAETVDEYLARVAQPARRMLNEMRECIRTAVPAGAMEIISYRIPAFRHKKVLVWYAAFSDHCSLFPTASIVKAFENELKGFTTSKGTIHFPIDKKLPKALIKKLVKRRVAEVRDEDENGL
jgi:uncharacterized protein YdhG (YjbR/CyaY superfamily)